jgi:hypothetical protein
MLLAAASARGEEQPALFDVGNGGTVQVKGSALTVMREGQKVFQANLPPYFDARHTPKKVPLSSGNGEMWVWAGGTSHAWCVRFAVFISTEAGRVNGMASSS